MKQLFKIVAGKLPSNYRRSGVGARFIAPLLFITRTGAMNRAPTRWFLTGMLFTTLALSGCVGKILQSKVDEPQTYVLQTSDAGTAKLAFPVQLSIAVPNAAPGLDTNRIAVLRNSNQLDYFYGARWGGTAPQIVQSFLVALLQAQQGYKNVVAESTRLDADYILDIDLRQFQAEYADATTAPVVHVALWVTVFEVKSRKAVATLRAAADVPAQDNRLSAVVTAFQSALQQASLSLSEQLAASMAKTSN